MAKDRKEVVYFSQRDAIDQRQNIAQLLNKQLLLFLNYQAPSTTAAAAATIATPGNPVAPSIRLFALFVTRAVLAICVLLAIDSLLNADGRGVADDTFGDCPEVACALI
jgi:hypothetical protein